MRLLKRWRRKRVRSRPFPGHWRAILERGLPMYHRLSPADREELHQHIQVFLAEKHFEGAGGMKVTDEMRVIIAAQACVLLLHRETDYFPGATSIIVYPDTYVARGRSTGPGGVVTEQESMRAGESWQHATGRGSGGPVILSWRDVQRGAADVNDGHNVVFHEFAHQLDGEAGGMDGAPALDRRSMYIAWARVLSGEYQSLMRDLAWRRPTLLRAYAATNPAEFFAVATELFFERPRELHAVHPELYQQLQQFYKQDPAQALESGNR